MKNFKEYAFGASMGQYQPVANLGDFAGKSYYGEFHANAEKKITQSDLDQVEKYADRLFAALGIDVEFTRHFMDRVNDARNIKQITVAELIRLFKQAHRRYGKKIAKMTDQANAVINDMKTDINMPFVIDIDRKGDMELIAKTVMRKKNFTTSASSPKLSFESFQSKLDEVASADFAPIAHQQSLSKIIFSPAGYGTDASATSTIRGGAALLQIQCGYLLVVLFSKECFQNKLEQQPFMLQTLNILTSYMQFKTQDVRYPHLRTWTESQFIKAYNLVVVLWLKLKEMF